jgi:hypothetical protein
MQEPMNQTACEPDSTPIKFAHGDVGGRGEEAAV